MTGQSAMIARLSTAPSLILWTDHARAKASFLSISRAGVEEAVLTRHARRTRNSGAGDWKLVSHGIAVIYNHLDREDATAARLVTLWRER